MSPKYNTVNKLGIIIGFKVIVKKGINMRDNLQSTQCHCVWAYMNE